MKQRKGLKVLLGILIVTMSLGMPVLADSPNGGGDAGIEEEPTRMEEFMWFYRTYNGIEQKRLWSLTYEYWVTDWIDIGPV